MGYNTLAQVKTAFLQRAFLDGTYKDEKCLEYIDNQLVQGDFKLSDYTSDTFTNHMNQIFSNSEVFSNGRMKKLNARHAARAATTGGKSEEATDSKDANLHINMSGDYGLISSSGGNSKVTIFDVANMLKMTNCLACRYPKNDPCNHHMHKCPLLAEFGLTVTYDPTKDQHGESLSNRFKQRGQAKAAKLKKAAEATAATSTPAQAPTPVAEGFQTVGKNGKDVKTTTEKELALKKSAGTGRSAGLGSFSPDGGFVDAHTAINDIKDDDSDYLTPIYTELSRLSRIDPTTQRMNYCIGSCKSVRKVCFDENVRPNQIRNTKCTTKNIPSRQIVPDSGATAHMLTEEDDFGNDYKKCRNVFVYMGDGTPVPVQGYKPGRIKMDGKVQVLKKALHVPTLDCSLLSITRHGRSGKGCSFIIENGYMHLTFPNFTINTSIPSNGNLRLPLEALSPDDWGEPDFTYEAGGDNYLDVFSNRINFLNRIHRGRAMTRGQRKKNRDQLQSCFEHSTSQNESHIPNIPSSTPDDDASSFNEFDDMGDDYLCEGDPGEMLKQALKELDMNDIKDLMQDSDTDAPLFEKQERKPPLQYHLESSRGDVIERLTNHTLQSYFGGRQLKDYRLLSKLGTGISVIDNKNDIPTVGSMVNRRRGKRRPFYGEKPDYRVLFPFGCVGAFRRVRDGTRDRTKFESQGLLGIALGNSEFTNGMVFYNPIMDSFCTSVDYILDKNRLVGEVFPNISYDGGLTTSVISTSSGPTKFDINEKIYIQCQNTYDILEATVITPPTSKSNYYTVKLDNDNCIDVKQEHMFTEHNIPASGKPLIALDFLKPKWLKQDQKVTMLIEDIYRQGYLSIGTENTWEFVVRDKHGKETLSESIADIAYLWKPRLHESTFDIGWQDTCLQHTYIILWLLPTSGKHCMNPTKITKYGRTHTMKMYGKKQQMAKVDETNPMDKKETKLLQQVCGNFLYYARAVDTTMLHALNDLATYGRRNKSMVGGNYNVLVFYKNASAPNPEGVVLCNTFK
ncbi:hypothetical protein FRACYDRAFT_244773 [Fragilariopsis cylindrus CCMP1102]|uniref:Retrovirus-related Pol polyprotein from transposon TNT 1-94-like beta-barrel domain-containing protein n=1 Tax=Fragilariopsis cylindrus CCMP1102 TaxID=635003 RepID=A0A1E7F0R6_9STRA|nr:hypothetical protein FRACYDRAFT_244773 [Fragilariopsis cylindrus CCMP1102]|eukprot:OEU11655.1 hypothetical protein FRACYDRAFT_244773 [Fragilariopsis cylindrus CCMP1102]